MNERSIIVSPDLAQKLIEQQFPEYASLPCVEIEKQGYEPHIGLANTCSFAFQQPKFDLAKFLKELQAVNDVKGPEPGQHNWWRGDHVSVYAKGAREQIAKLAENIDASKGLALWDKACATKWDKKPVWIHGDFAIGNMLMYGGKLSAVIDFGGAAVGDPACDLVIAWTYLSGKARESFLAEMDRF